MIAPHIKETINSKGASVIRKMFEEGMILRKKFGDDNVFDFSIGNPDLEPPIEVVQAIKEIANSTLKGQHGYMPNAGYQSTRQAMADKVSLEQNTKLTWEHTVMSVGAASALNAIFKAILSPSDQVIVPSPFFAEYTNYVKNYSGVLVSVPTKKDDFSLDIEAIKDALTEKTQAVLINSPNNPTGKIYSKDEIIQLSQILKEHGKKVNRMPYLICDEPYRDITYDSKKVSEVFPYYDNAIIASSFAKNLSIPGERIGYIAVNPSCEDVNEFIAAVTFTTRVLGYVNAPAFFQRVVEKSWNAKVDYSSYHKRCKQISTVVQNAGIQFTKPEGAFYLWCKVPPKPTDGVDYIGNDFEFTDHLKKYNILAAPGTGFGCSGYFRMAFCVSEKTILNSQDAFIKAMKDWK